MRFYVACKTLLLSTCAGLVGCSGGAESPAGVSTASSDEPARAGRVIVISLDTLRADRLSLYGYERPTSPELERFASQATVYTRAQAAAPWTLPSHVSLFTGKHPYEHGARTWPVEQLAALQSKGWTPNNNAAPLADGHTTLAEVLQAEGYATAAVVCNLAFMDPHYGVAQGFDLYDQKRTKWQGVNKRALRWIDEQGEQPFFLFLNYMDTHRPVNRTPRPGFEDASAYGDALLKVGPLVLNPDAEVPTDLLQACHDQYDLSIANLDEGLGQLFDGLRERGLFEGTTILITSDHGEFLGEKRLIEHSKDVYQGVLHVPLLLKAPGQQEARTDERWIGHVHMAGLLLEHLELANREAAEALLVHHRRGLDPLLSENYYTRHKDLKAPWGDRFRRVRRTLVEGPWKYIESSDGQHELYDLDADPLEETSLVDSAPIRFAELRAAMARLLGDIEPAPLPGTLAPLSEEHLEVMSDLGYAGK